MNNKMKKSKYAALVLASTMALSTVVTAAPQAFDNNAITAHAASVNEGKEYESATTGEGATKKTALTVEGVAYDLTISTDTATITIGKNKTITAKKGDVIVLNGLNLKVTEVKAAVVDPASDPSFKVEVIEQQTAGSVTEAINDLDVSSATYATDVAAVKSLFDLLTKDEKEKVKNKDLLTAHDKYSQESDNTKALKAAFPTEFEIKAITEYDLKEDAVNKVKETVKNKEVERVINAELEKYVKILIDFDEAIKKITDKNEKKIFSERAKEGKALLKLAQTQQKVVAASFDVESFNTVYDALTLGGSPFTTNEIKVTVKNGKFKIDNDSYELKDGTETNAGKYILVTPVGEEILTLTDGKAEFTIENKDTDSDLSTTMDSYSVEKKDGDFLVIKQKETYEFETAVPVLKFDSKMSVNAYKTLKAGTKKYEDSQIEAITTLSSIYKSLTSDGKKQITKAQVAKLKQYEKALKAQEALEKKLVAEDSKGVTKLISSLKYGKDYATSITAARTAYDGLTPKFQKKIKSSVLVKLKDHEAAITVITAIDNLPSANLLLAKADDTAETATGLAKLKAEIKVITEGKTATTGTYDKLEKSQKSLVKNYKDIASIEKQITSQEKYLLKANNDLIVAWQTALENVTKTTDVQILNNKFAIGSDIYTLSYDKTTKKSTVKQGETVIKITETGKETATETLTDVAKGNVTGTFTVDTVKYQLSAAKGKFKVDKLTATEDAPALEVHAFTTNTDISNAATKLYTVDQAKLISDTITAYENVAKVKDAKAFVNKDDVTAYNAYVKALKAQQALEKKDLAAAKQLLDKKTVEVEAGEGADTTKILSALKGLANADKNKFIKDLTVASLAVSDKKLTITVDSETKFEMTVKEKPSAAEVAAKTAIHDKKVSVAKEKLTDKTTVLAAIKELSPENEVLKALAESNIEIASGKATVTLPSGDKAIVTIEEKTAS